MDAETGALVTAPPSLFEQPPVVGLDIETHSAENLRAVGSWRYFRHPSTKVITVQWGILGDPTPPRVWIYGQPVPQELVWLIAERRCILSGWNVMLFDRIGWDMLLVPQGFPPVPGDRWLDSMHFAAHANMPRSLEGAGRFIGADVQKDKEGHALMMKLTNEKRTPWSRLSRVLAAMALGRDPAVEAADEKKWLPQLHEDAKRFVWGYAATDVSAEAAILARVPPWCRADPWPRMPAVDRRINDRGILLDIPLIEGLRKAAESEIRRLDARMEQVTQASETTGVRKCSQVERIKGWLAQQVEVRPDGTKIRVELPLTNPETDDDDEDDLSEEEAEERDQAASRKSKWRLSKTDIVDLLMHPLPFDREEQDEQGEKIIVGPVRSVLEMRAEAAKASTMKLKKMLAMVCPDGRLRGSRKLMGAQATGRATSGGAQFYNFIRNTTPHPDEISKRLEIDFGGKVNKDVFEREMALALRGAILDGRSGDADRIRSIHGSVMPWVSRMMRRTLSAPVGKKLITADWKSIEAIITDWMAGHEVMLGSWRDTIAGTGDDPYCVTAAPVFGLTPKEIKNDKEKRQAGKIIKLSCGFSGAHNAVLRMAFAYGIRNMSEEQARQYVGIYRSTNLPVVAFWDNVFDCICAAINNPGHEFFVPPLGLISYRMDVERDRLLCRLPSGRELTYWSPRLHPADEDWKKPIFSVLHFASNGRAWRRPVWRGLAVENLAQSIGVDFLVRALVTLDEHGSEIVLDVYDQIADETWEGDIARRLLMTEQVMTDVPQWAPGIPLGVDAHASERFG